MTSIEKLKQQGYDPKGSVAVVTGGASGIGLALCKHLAAEGAKKVVVVDLDMGKAQAVVDSLPRGVGVAISANCGVEMDIRRVVITAIAQCGRIDAFFANAGIPSNGGVDVTNDEWDRIWRVNVMQIVWVGRHLFPKWEQKKQSGFFCVTASAAGLLTQIGSLPYSVSKHAAVATAEWLRITYQSKNIIVTCICPQAVQTGMLPPKKEEIENGLKGGGPAGGDGVLDPLDVAKITVDAMRERKFMVMPHPTVEKYFKRKAGDYDRWIKGMGKMQAKFGQSMADSPNMSAAKL